MGFLDELPSDPAARAFASEQTDAFLAEVLSFDAAAHAMLGETADLGETVERLTAVYEGEPQGVDLAAAPTAARQLADNFSRKQLPSARTEVAGRILDALRSRRRFRPDSVMGEVKLARKLAQRLIAASGPDLHPDSLVDAFTHRSARLLAPEAVEEAIADARDPAEQIDRLFDMEDNLVGAQNKTKLAGYLRARLTSNKTEAFCRHGPGQPFEGRARLSALQARALKGSFPDRSKGELAETFDQIGLKLLDETKAFSKIAAVDRPALDQAAALLKLAVNGVLPQGRCLQDAQARAMRLLASDMARKEAVSETGRTKLAGVQALLTALQPAAKPSADDDASSNEESAA